MAVLISVICSLNNVLDRNGMYADAKGRAIHSVSCFVKKYR